MTGTEGGRFIDFVLTFQGKSAEQQAREILQRVDELLAEGASGVGITYSANFDQTQEIRGTYADGGWDTRTAGANQASVMAAMEALERTDRTDLRGKVRIVPITTMTYSDFGGMTLDQVIDRDMSAIAELLADGWDVLGWINDPASGRYAVGGGVAASVYQEDPTRALSRAQSERIQDALAALARG